MQLRTMIVATIIALSVAACATGAHKDKKLQQLAQEAYAFCAQCVPMKMPLMMQRYGVL